MHPLIAEDIARGVVAELEARAARYRVACAVRRPRRVRLMVGRAFIAAGQRLLGA
jgi:hypothetical protein